MCLETPNTSGGVRSYASCVGGGEDGSAMPHRAVHHAGHQGRSGQTKPSVASSFANELDRQYNLVICGIADCEAGIHSHFRQSHDVVRVCGALSTSVESFHGDSIRDLYRLGKYRRDQHHPCPLLVKFLRIADVSAVLSALDTPCQSTDQEGSSDPQDPQGEVCAVGLSSPPSRFVCSSDFDVLCLTETWLSESPYNSEIIPLGFTMYRKDRATRGGGVLVAVRDLVSAYA